MFPWFRELQAHNGVNPLLRGRQRKYNTWTGLSCSFMSNHRRYQPGVLCHKHSSCGNAPVTDGKEDTTVQGRREEECTVQERSGQLRCWCLIKASDYFTSVGGLASQTANYPQLLQSTTYCIVSHSMFKRAGLTRKTSNVTFYRFCK